MTLLGLAIVLFSPTPHVAAAPVPDARALREKCGDEFFSQIEVAQCMEKAARESEKTLERAEKKVLDVLSKWKEWEEYVREAKDNFEASKKEFVKYREVQCKYVVSLAGGRLGRESVRLTCIAGLNNHRAMQLRDEVDYMDMPMKGEKRQEVPAKTQ
jgi:uncharacterized protein YecT (DUF1311 family)